MYLLQGLKRMKRRMRRLLRSSRRDNRPQTSGATKLTACCATALSRKSAPLSAVRFMWKVSVVTGVRLWAVVTTLAARWVLK